MFRHHEMSIFQPDTSFFGGATHATSTIRQGPKFGGDMVEVSQTIYGYIMVDNLWINYI